MERDERDASMAEASETNLLARDVYRSAAALATFVVLWMLGASVVGAPYPESFDAGRLMLVIFAIITLAYLVHTWRVPRLRVAFALSTIGLATTVVLLPWAAVLAARLGEQWQPIAAAQLVIAAVPLTAPFQWVAYVLLATFTLEVILILLYQQHVGLELPAAEPFVSLCISALALAVLLLRKKRHEVGLAIISTRAERTALERLSPLLAAIREELERTIDALSTISGVPEATARALSRSIARLRALRERLVALLTSSPEALADRERQLLARDSHTGAMIFALAGTAVVVLAAWGTRELPLGRTPTLFLCLGLSYAAITLWLWITRRYPTIRRGLIASIMLLVSGSVVAAYIHIHWVRLPEHDFPSTAQKLLLMVPVLLRLPRLWIGVMMVVLTALSHVGIQLAVASEHPALELWHTLIFALIGLGYLVMGEQRRIASLALLRAEAEASSLFRHANLSLALCDQLNTPLQTVMGVVATLPTDAAATAAAHIDRLRESSKELARLVGQLPPELHRSSLNGAGELEPHSPSLKVVRTRT